MPSNSSHQNYGSFTFHERITYQLNLFGLARNSNKYNDIFNNDILLSSIIQDGSRSQSCNYVLKPLSAHTNQLLFSLELTFPKPISSPEWDFSPNSYMLLINQSFNNLQEF
ncbi:unnamed protein product [Rhizophagus irregularis]|nr:unnamed protein product [Rhizophagus irregularis]CAB5384799.1 unnamed protein product [Rhizophagus irregularis]